MFNRNQVEIAGHLFEDPKVFDSAVILKVGVNRPKRRNKETGEYEDQQPDAVEGKILLEQPRNYAADYFKKGAHIFLQGKLQKSSFVDQATGEKRYSQDFIINSVEFVCSKSE